MSESSTHYRVERIRIELDVYTSFQGRHTIKFDYEPKFDDPLVIEALKKNEERLKAELERIRFSDDSSSFGPIG